MLPTALSLTTAAFAPIPVSVVVLLVARRLDCSAAVSLCKSSQLYESGMVTPCSIASLGGPFGVGADRLSGERVRVVLEALLAASDEGRRFFFSDSLSSLVDDRFADVVDDDDVLRSLESFESFFESSLPSLRESFFEVLPSSTASDEDATLSAPDGTRSDRDDNVSDLT